MPTTCSRELPALSRFTPGLRRQIVDSVRPTNTKPRTGLNSLREPTELGGYLFFLEVRLTKTQLYVVPRLSLFVIVFAAGCKDISTSNDEGIGDYVPRTYDAGHSADGLRSIKPPKDREL